MMKLKMTLKKYDNKKLIELKTEFVNIQKYQQIMNNKNPFSAKEVKGGYQYTAMGYIPLRLTTTSPDKKFKNIWVFEIK